MRVRGSKVHRRYAFDPRSLPNRFRSCFEYAIRILKSVFRQDDHRLEWDSRATDRRRFFELEVCMHRILQVRNVYEAMDELATH